MYITWPEWRTIDSAPKDGTWILLYPSIGSCFPFDFGRWDEDRFARKPRPFWYRHGSISKRAPTAPTHLGRASENCAMNKMRYTVHILSLVIIAIPLFGVLNWASTGHFFVSEFEQGAIAGAIVIRLLDAIENWRSTP